MDAPIKLTLKADWGISRSKKGDKKLHGRIYRAKDGSYLFVSASYDGVKVKFRAWPCTRSGKHEQRPLFMGTDTTITQFLSRFGYLNEETGQYQREAHLLDIVEDEAADGSPMEIATYHVSPPMGGSQRTSTVEVITKYVGNSNLKCVRVTYPDGVCDVNESIGWDTDAQALGKLGITVADETEPVWDTTAHDLLMDAMRRNRDDDNDLLQLSGGNWDARLDTRTDRPELTAWSRRYVYAYTVNGSGMGCFLPAPRNPRLPRHARANRTRMIRELFADGASGTYSREDAETVFDRWLADERMGMGRTLTVPGDVDA